VLPTEQSRPDIAARRTRWKAHQGKIDPKRLVFLDETWVKTNMAPLRGWGPRGQRLKARVPHGHWKTLTFIGALCQRPGMLTHPAVEGSRFFVFEPEG
jgi:hypothetical protein